MKNKLLSLFIICLFTLLGNAQLSTGGGSACDCETVLNPTLELTDFNADTCTATLVASPGDSPCLDNYYLIYKWHRASGGPIITGNNPSITYEDFGDLGDVKVEVEARISQSGYTLCSAVSLSIPNDGVTCNANNGEITISKRAYSTNGNRIGSDEIDPQTGITNDVGGEIYRNQIFEWRVTIENTFTTNYCMFYEDLYPDVVVDGIICDFTIISATLEQPGATPIVAQLSDIINIPPGTTTLSFITHASVDPGCTNQVVNGECLNYTNTFKYTLLQGACPTDINFTSQQTGATSAVSSSVCVRAGCPMGLTDGFCVLPEDMKTGDVLDIDMNGHVPFYSIKKMEGDITYDSGIFSTPSIQLINAIEMAGFVALLEPPTADGTVHFTVQHADPNSNATFNISIANGYNPMHLSFQFIQDLQECTEVSVINFRVTTTSGTSDAFMDPGTFCVDYGNYYGEDYESAWITAAGGETCVSSNQSLSLTALGPFETQNPNSQYVWTKNGSTNVIGESQQLDVTSSGFYKVNITDQNGCAREADILIDACPVTCSCGDLNPEITSTIEGCSVIFDVSTQNCDNVNIIQFEWEFSNGNTFNGQNPPPQYNWPNGGNLTAKLRVKYAIGFQTCIELDAETAFIPCRGPRKRELSLYPNPAKSNVTVALDGEDTVNGTIEVVNIYGVKVLEVKASKKETNLNVSTLRAGIYFVKHTDVNKNTTVKRLSISQ